MKIIFIGAGKDCVWQFWEEISSETHKQLLCHGKDCIAWFSLPISSLMASLCQLAPPSWPTHLLPLLAVALLSAGLASSYNGQVLPSWHGALTENNDNPSIWKPTKASDNQLLPRQGEICQSAVPFPCHPTEAKIARCKKTHPTKISDQGVFF